MLFILRIERHLSQLVAAQQLLDGGSGSQANAMGFHSQADGRPNLQAQNDRRRRGFDGGLPLADLVIFVLKY